MKKKPTFARSATAAVLSILVLLLGATIILGAFRAPSGIPAEGKIYKVEKGEGAATLARRLARKV